MIISQRAGICAGADSVQYMYAVGTTPPASAEAEGLKAEISTRASFNLDAGSASSGKYLYIYLRWYNTKHPALAGPWSSMKYNADTIVPQKGKENKNI